MLYIEFNSEIFPMMRSYLVLGDGTVMAGDDVFTEPVLSVIDHKSMTASPSFRKTEEFV